MATWRQFEEQAPELAAAVRERFGIAKHCTMATLRKDGSPRISGTEIEFAHGEMRIGSMPGAVKARDLQRDPRVAIHSPTVDPADDGASWQGEAKVAGRAIEARTSAGADGGAHTFTIDLQEVVLTRLGMPADHLEILSWHEGRGIRVRKRR